MKYIKIFENVNISARTQYWGDMGYLSKYKKYIFESCD